MPFSSKGLDAAYRAAANRAIAELWRWSEGGRVPVLTDASPCAWTLKQAGSALSRENKEKFRNLTILDGIEFAHDVLLERLDVTPVRRTVALHPVCSVRKMGLEAKLLAVARACTDRVDVPVNSACCGMAGDRGFLFPELPQAALGPLVRELEALDYDDFLASSRSCEAGLVRITGKPYRSFWHLLDEASS
jgi:D-lactate dehydrogenase